MKAERKLIAGLSAAAIALSCMSMASFAEDPALNSFEATSDNVRILGRAKYMTSADALWFGLTNAGIEYNFTGTTTAVNITADSSAHSNDNPARIKIFADNQLYLDALTTEETADFTVNFEESGVHTVKLIKVSESENGSLRINEIKADSDSITPTEPQSRKIEFIGDSITCGYGVDGKSGGFSTKTEDGSKTYAYKAAQKLNADYSMVSFSGFGILSGYTTDGVRNTTSTLPQYYDKLGFSWYNQFGSDNTQLKNVEWDASQFEPDLIVVNLGTNDASYIQYVKGNDKKEEERKAFCEAYVDFIGMIRGMHPNSEILCTLGIMGQDLCPQVEEAVNTYKSNTGDEHVNYLKFNVQNTEKNGTGIDWHPAPQSHVDAAYELLDAVEDLYGWQADPDVDIDIPVEPSLKIKGDKDIKLTEIKDDGVAVTVAIEPVTETEVTFTVADSNIADISVDPSVNPGMGAAESNSVTITTSPENGEAIAYVYARNTGKTTITATTDDGLSATINVEVDLDTVSEPDSSSEDSSEADTSSEADSTADSTESTTSSSSSSNSSKPNSSASGKENASSDTNPATGAAAGAATAVILLALGTVVVSRKSKK